MRIATRAGTLGPRAVAELGALKVLRARLDEQAAALGAKEATLLALVAEAQGCVAGPATRYDYDLDAGTWRALDTETPDDA